MVKRLILWGFAICFCFLFGVTVSAETYSDNMESATSDSVKSYYNLKTSGASSMWKNQLPDNSFLVFANSEQPTAKAVYMVQSAKELSVSVYTNTGSFTSWAPSSNVYALGFYQAGVIKNRPQDHSRALYSPSRREVYRGRGSGFQSVVYDTFYQFKNSTESEPNDLIDYAVNAYYSVDGQSYNKINLTPGDVWYSSSAYYCQEFFTGTVPSGTKMIMVEINDFNRYYDVPYGKTETKLDRLMTSLASVSITGDKLILGPVRENSPESSEPQASSLDEESSQISELSSSSSSQSSSLSSSSSTSSNSSSSTKSSSSSSAKSSSSSKASSTSSKASSSSKKAAVEDDDEASSKKASSSKFEGVITSAVQSGGGQTQSRATVQASPKSSKSVASPASGSAAPPETPEGETSPSHTDRKEQEIGGAPVILSAQPIIHNAPAKDNDENIFTWAVTAYIIIVSGAILFFVLKPKK